MTEAEKTAAEKTHHFVSYFSIYIFKEQLKKTNKAHWNPINNMAGKRDTIRRLEQAVMEVPENLPEEIFDSDQDGDLFGLNDDIVQQLVPDGIHAEEHHQENEPLIEMQDNNDEFGQEESDSKDFGQTGSDSNQSDMHGNGSVIQESVTKQSTAISTASKSLQPATSSQKSRKPNTPNVSRKSRGIRSSAASEQPVATVGSKITKKSTTGKRAGLTKSEKQLVIPVIEAKPASIKYNQQIYQGFAEELIEWNKAQNIDHHRHLTGKQVEQFFINHKRRTYKLAKSSEKNTASEIVKTPNCKSASEMPHLKGQLENASCGSPSRSSDLTQHDTSACPSTVNEHVKAVSQAISTDSESDEPADISSNSRKPNTPNISREVTCTWHQVISRLRTTSCYSWVQNHQEINYRKACWPYKI